MRDLSVSRVQELRDQFERNMDFYEEISDVFQQVKKLIEQYHAGLAAEMRERPTAHLVITSNHRFYGALNQEVMQAFLKDWNEADDHVVVGWTGERLMEFDDRYKDCTFMHFKEDNPTRREMQKLVSWAKGYDTVVVYYPQYRDPFHQEPTTMDITNATSSTTSETSIEQFIFEPDLPLVHDFFSTQVQFILIQRVMLETDLSRMAARLIRMDSAENSAAEMYEDKRKELKHTIQTQLDRQLSESISGRNCSDE